MSYSVRIKRSAAKELARIPEQDPLRIVQAIDGLGERPLTGSPLKGERRGLRRVRVGDYRIVYEVVDDALVVLVVRVTHRGESTAVGEHSRCALEFDRTAAAPSRE